ncbi:permease prefix domain 1-containing protein [Actinopolymorpha sp. B17G11]|uniref:permease prefix domain 1-containing protein n=1 Tax=unclassified Actinopolymorpha TaxID=2627063 RepID=UPI0032D9542F
MSVERRGGAMTLPVGTAFVARMAGRRRAAPSRPTQRADPSAAPQVDSIAGYLRALARALPGPRRTRTELLGELADGLHDAADAYVRAGMDPRQAEAQAVGDCGRIAEIAPAYRAELIAAQSRRTAMLFALSMPATVLAWTLAWTIGVREVPSLLTSDHPRLAIFLSQVTDLAGMAGGVSGLATLGLLMWSGRLRRFLRPVIAGQVVVGATVLAVTMGCSTAMNLLDPSFALRVAGASALVPIVGAATCVLGGWQVHSLWRTFRAVAQ